LFYSKITISHYLKGKELAVIGPLADAKKTWQVLGLATKMEQSISLVAGIKSVLGNNGTVLYAKGNLDLP
jgi:beta-glucosidase